MASLAPPHPSISHQDISADAFEDAAAPESKEADEGAKVGRVDVLHVRHRHPLQPVHVCHPHVHVRHRHLLKPGHVTLLLQLVQLMTTQIQTN